MIFVSGKMKCSSPLQIEYNQKILTKHLESISYDTTGAKKRKYTDAVIKDGLLNLESI